MGLPDPERYQLAVHFAKVADWCCNGQLKLWVLMEEAGSPFLLSGSPYTDLTAMVGAPLAAYTLKMVGLAYRKMKLSELYR